MARRRTLTLLLLPWLLFGQGEPRRQGVAAGERVLSSTSIVDVSSNPAYRIDNSRDLAVVLGVARRNPNVPVRHMVPLADSAVVAQALFGAAWKSTSSPSAERPSPRPKRLTIPHNANAPPVRES
jgi:hypothetical protein